MKLGERNGYTNAALPTACSERRVCECEIDNRPTLTHRGLPPAAWSKQRGSRHCRIRTDSDPFETPNGIVKGPLRAVPFGHDPRTGLWSLSSTTRSHRSSTWRSPSFFAFSGSTSPVAVNLCSAKMLFRLARSRTANSRLATTKLASTALQCNGRVRSCALPDP